MLGAMVGRENAISHGLSGSQALNFLSKRDICTARKLLPGAQIPIDYDTVYDVRPWTLPASTPFKRASTPYNRPGVQF
jgi:hypothetical protein